MNPSRPLRFLLAGARPGKAAGNSVSTEVLLDALASAGDVDLLTHDVRLLPRLQHTMSDQRHQFAVGAFPSLVHAEGTIAGRLHGRTLRDRAYALAWAVNSRYASSLKAARLPYVIWEATTIRDELDATSARETRRAGRGTGVGAFFHKVTLPLDERLERTLYRGSCATLAMSEYCRQRIGARYPRIASRIGVLQHPPSRAFLNALRRVTEDEASRQGTVAGSARLLFVGRLDDPRKNADLLLDVGARLRSNGCDAALTLVGSCTSVWQSTRREALRRANATLAGVVTVDELVRAYRSHDLMVVPSRQEGFGIVIAEALHAGLPIVSTACGGPEDVLAASGGGVVAGSTADALVRSIQLLLNDPDRMNRMSESGVRYARAHLSTIAFEHAVHETIDRILQGPHHELPRSSWSAVVTPCP